MFYAAVLWLGLQHESCFCIGVRLNEYWQWTHSHNSLDIILPSTTNRLLTEGTSLFFYISSTNKVIIPQPPL